MINEVEQNFEAYQEQLKSLELAEIKNFLEKREFSPENPDTRLFLTPIEHKLMGSTLPGRAFYPNHPLPLVFGYSLEQLNRCRKEYNQRQELWFGLREESGIVKIFVELLPLTPEIVAESSPKITFKILKAEDPEGEETEITEKTLKVFEEEIILAQNQAREQLSKKLVSK